MKQLLTKEEVAKAIQDLADQGKKPTLVAVHAALKNRGSMSTLVRLKAELRRTQTSLEEANLRATAALQKLSETQSACAHEVTALRVQLDLVVGRAHELEL